MVVVRLAVVAVDAFGDQDRLDSSIPEHDSSSQQAIYTGEGNLSWTRREHFMTSSLQDPSHVPMRIAVDVSWMATGTGSFGGGGFGGAQSAIGLKLILRRSAVAGDSARGCRSIDSMDSTRWSDMMASSCGKDRRSRQMKGRETCATYGEHLLSFLWCGESWPELLGPAQGRQVRADPCMWRTGAGDLQANKETVETERKDLGALENILPKRDEWEYTTGKKTEHVEQRNRR